MIIFDSDWNPQNDIQAQARAHRIGQTRFVKVYRLLTRATYETVMFRAASLKLGLDYAVMHNLKGQQPSLAGLRMDKSADTMSGLSKRELENLLKHGAYDIFREESDGTGVDASQKFCEADIDEILEKSALFLHDEHQHTKNVKTSTSFSKASFVSAEGSGNNVALDDPDFWTKIVGLASAADDDEDGAGARSRKRRCRETTEGFYNEAGIWARSQQVDSDSDGSDDDDAAAANRKSQSKHHHRHRALVTTAG